MRRKRSNEEFYTLIVALPFICISSYVGARCGFYISNIDTVPESYLVVTVLQVIALSTLLAYLVRLVHDKLYSSYVIEAVTSIIILLSTIAGIVVVYNSGVSGSLTLVTLSIACSTGLSGILLSLMTKKKYNEPLKMAMVCSFVSWFITVIVCLVN